MKAGMGPLALIISPSEKQRITHKLPKPPCPLNYFPFRSNDLCKNNLQMSDTALLKIFNAYHPIKEKPYLRSERAGHGARKHHGNNRNSVNSYEACMLRHGANIEWEFLRV